MTRLTQAAWWPWKKKPKPVFKHAAYGIIIQHPNVIPCMLDATKFKLVGDRSAFNNWYATEAERDYVAGLLAQDVELRKTNAITLVNCVGEYLPTEIAIP